MNEEREAAWKSYRDKQLGDWSDVTHSQTFDAGYQAGSQVSPMTEAEQYSRCGKCGICAYCKAIRSHIRDIRQHAAKQAGSEGRGEVAEERKRIAGELEKIAFFPIITRIPYLLADYIKDRLRADGEKDDGQD